MTRSLRHTGRPPAAPAGARGSSLDAARALGDSTRSLVFRTLLEAPGALAVRDVVDRVGVHHNAVRRHLAVLRDAGLVDEAREARDRPGRPRLLYRVSRDGRALADGPAPYRRLAEMLLDVVRTGRPPREVGRERGRRDAAALGPPAVDALVRETARQRFDPRPDVTPDGVDLVLAHCPLAEVAAVDTRTVCDLHLGVAEGLVEQIGGAVVTGIVVHDPAQAGCRIRISTRQGRRPGRGEDTP